MAGKLLFFQYRQWNHCNGKPVELSKRPESLYTRWRIIHIRVGRTPSKCQPHKYPGLFVGLSSGPFPHREWFRGGGWWGGECRIVSDKLTGGPNRPTITLRSRFIHSLSGYAFHNNKSTMFSSSLLCYGNFSTELLNWI